MVLRAYVYVYAYVFVTVYVFVCVRVCIYLCLALIPFPLKTSHGLTSQKTLSRHRTAEHQQVSNTVSTVADTGKTTKAGKDFPCYKGHVRCSSIGASDR